MESAMSSDTMMEFGNSTEPVDENLSVESASFFRLLTLRRTILSRLCEEVRSGRLTAVNSLFEPYGFSVNPEFLKNLSGRLRIMRDIEIALNELNYEDLITDHVFTEMQLITPNDHP